MTDFQGSTPTPAPPVPPDPGTPPPPLPDPDVEPGPPDGPGGMGVSSERVPDDPGSIEGTGSRGTSTSAPTGTWPTIVGEGGQDEEEDVESRAPTVPRDQVITQEWRENQPAPNVFPVQRGHPLVSSGTAWQGIDRTVGEENPATTPPHQFDRRRNPGHSHG